MPTTEQQMKELLKTLNINELALLVELANERKEVMENALVENAKAKFIKAYQDFRKLAPNVHGWLCWRYKNNHDEWEEQDFDLYDMLDFAIEEGIL